MQPPPPAPDWGMYAIIGMFMFGLGLAIGKTWRDMVGPPPDE